MKIEFKQREHFECYGRRKGPIFEKGDVLDCTQEFGERWIRLDAAVETNKRATRKWPDPDAVIDAPEPTPAAVHHPVAEAEDD